MSTFHCTVLGHSVSIEADTAEVRRRLTTEFTPFYDVSPNPGHTELATVRAVTSPYQGSVEVRAGAEVAMHNGHRSDGRRGFVTTVGNMRHLWSPASGSVFVLDDRLRSAVIYNPKPESLAADCRRIVRNQIMVPWLESLGGMSVHATAFRVGGVGYLVTGNRGAGKTSFLLAAMSLGRSGDRFGSGDRVVVRAGERPMAVSCPEPINTYPGSMAQHPQMAALAMGECPSTHWDRAAKRRVPWRQLFDCFDAVPACDPLAIDVVLFPRYRANATGVDVRPLERPQIRTRMTDNVISGRGPKRPNWLRWFDATSGESALGQLVETPGYSVDWAEADQLRQWMRVGADLPSNRRHSPIPGTTQ